MNKDFSQTPRPTFKRALRRISVISVVISMTLVWLLLSTASIFTLKQYAQKNLELTAATMGRSLEAALARCSTSPRGAMNRWPIKSK